MVARRGPPPRLGICYDAGPRAAVRARLRPGDARVPLRRERPVRLAAKCRGWDHRPVPDRAAGASHVGADRRRRARPEGERSGAGRLRVGAACWAREAPVGIEPTNRGFAVIPGLLYPVAPGTNLLILATVHDRATFTE